MRRRISVLIFPDFQILDATGPVAAFAIASRFVPDAYAVKVIAPEAGAVTSTSGAALMAEGLKGPTPHTLLIAGGSGVRQAATDKRLLAYVRRVAKKAERVVSVCSGAYVLAAAGLLDGLRATSHWSVCNDLQRRFPAVQVEPDSLYIRQGRIWTSAGITAGIDLTLALITEDLGETAARRTAQQLVVYYRRPGGQSQFSALVEMEGERFDTLLGWAREHLSESLTVERLAEKAAMSPRTFARAFAAATGTTPARAIERLRVEAARPRIEAGEDSVKAVAAAVGFGNAERMRRAFIRAFGQPPQVLRRTH